MLFGLQIHAPVLGSGEPTLHHALTLEAVPEGKLLGLLILLS